ncbi:hypothetical protein U1Q18_012090 [Sarracenia purpurea var. burkii]
MDYHQRCSYYRTDQQPVRFGSQVVHSIDDTIKTSDFIVKMNSDNPNVRDNHEQHNDQDQHDTIETDDFVVKMNSGNPSVRDSDKLVTRSNNVTQLPLLPEIAQPDAREKNHHQICSNNRTDQLPIGFEPQIIHSIADTVETDDCVVKMNSGNASVRDSDELVAQSNNVIQFNQA